MLASNGIDKLRTDLLVVGTVRNCAAHLKADVLRLRLALAKAKHLYWLLIESDSTDASLQVLKELAARVENFRFLTLGTLSTRMPLRTERLAHCRNKYLSEIATNPIYKDVEYVIVSDFDGVNSKITEDAILSCWDRDDWDVCTANQKGPYYDIWPLRHKDWCANDCWAQFRFFTQYDPDPEKVLYASVYSKMITLPSSSEWIEVDSAFGGLAIYRRHAIEKSLYVGLDDKGEELCEHVLFHKGLKQQGCRIFINPKLINATYTEYTERLRWRKRALRKAKALSKDILALTKTKVLIKKTLIVLMGRDAVQRLRLERKPKE